MLLKLYSQLYANWHFGDKTPCFLISPGKCMLCNLMKSFYWDVTKCEPQMRNLKRHMCLKIHNLILIDWLIVLGFNDTPTLVGHFVSSPREREKRDRRDSRGDLRERQGRKKNRNTRNKNIPRLPQPATRIASLAQLQAKISWTPRWRKLHTTPSHHPTTPKSHPESHFFLLEN